EFQSPQWDGRPSTGETLLLYPEQGIGDVIQMLRYLPLIVSLGWKPLLSCSAELIPFFSMTLSVQCATPSQLLTGSFIAHASIIRLPAILGTTINTIPTRIPYAVADKELVDRWRRQLPEGFKVGICWQGSESYPADVARSFPLSTFAPLAN